MSYEPKRPRSLFWLLLPSFLGVIGSVIIHFKLKQDYKNNRGTHHGMNKFSWFLGILVTAILVFDLYSWIDYPLFGMLNDCEFYLAEDDGRALLMNCWIDHSVWNNLFGERIFVPAGSV